MSKSRLIFIFILLTGMIFTLFQYIPILDEEFFSYSKELSKKSNEPESSEDDGDGDSEDDITFEYSLNDLVKFSYHIISSNKIYTKNKIYNCLVEDIKSPPPKI
jgi:hypothetical protein